MDWYCVNIEICTKLMRCNIFKYINSFLLYQMVYLHVKLTVNKLYINKEAWIYITKYGVKRNRSTFSTKSKGYE